MDPRLRAQNHRASPTLNYAREHMSVMQCSSCRNFHACMTWLSCGFEGRGAALCGAGSREFVLLGAVCWHCYATFMTRADVSMQHPAAGLAQTSSTPVHSSMWTCSRVICQSHFVPPSSQHGNCAASSCGYWKRGSWEDATDSLEEPVQNGWFKKVRAWAKLRKVSEMADKLEILLCRRKVCA